jgi:very-short-patch-repair endonuclease
MKTITSERTHIELPMEIALLGLGNYLKQRGYESVETKHNVPIGPYFADYVVTRPTGIRVVVECDGHDFHFRTPAQAQHDRIRDRYMLSNGFAVMRFTGSEIKRQPIECASEVFAFVFPEIT